MLTLTLLLLILTDVIIVEDNTKHIATIALTTTTMLDFTIIAVLLRYLTHGALQCS